MLSHSQIEDHAAAWLAKRDSGEWAPADQRGLAEWLAEATAHRVAFLRLEATWEEARRLKAVSAGLPAGIVPPQGGWRQSPYFEPGGSGTAAVARGGRSFARPLGVAASILVAALLGALVYVLRSGFGDDQYSTSVGALASVPLQDGSAVTLNTGSRIRVALKARERRVELEQGEAFFVVAKDPTRSFVVTAGGKRIVALGTQFSVRRDGADLRVIVTEGAVRVESAKRSGQLTAGSVAHTRDDDLLVQNESVGEAERLLSWREGYLTFHETSLAEAAAELNRYNTRHIIIDDPKVAAIRISGTFKPNHYEAFVRLMQEGYAIQATPVGGNIKLSQN